MSILSRNQTSSVVFLPIHASGSSITLNISGFYESVFIYSFPDIEGLGRVCVSGRLVLRYTAWLGILQPATDSLLGLLGSLGGPVTRLPTVQTDKGRSVPLGTSRRWRLFQGSNKVTSGN